MGWILGYDWPYPTNLQMFSGWWLAFASLGWFALVWLNGRWLASRARASLAVCGPTLASLVLGTWTASLLMYEFGGWKLDGTLVGFRWILEGPQVAIWHRFAEIVLGAMNVPVSISPRHFVDGSSVVGHVDATIMVLGLLNEAALACLAATGVATVLVWLVRRIEGSPANPPLNPTVAKSAPAG